MTSFRALLRALATAVPLVLVGCGGGSDDDSTVLLDCNGDGIPDAGSCSGSGARGATLELTCVSPAFGGKLTSGYSVVLRSRTGNPVANQFVSLQPVDADGDVGGGSIRGSTASGGQQSGGGTTNSSGRITFSFTPSEVSRATSLQILAAIGEEGADDRLEETCEVEVQPNTARLQILGPGGLSTGALELESGESVTGFLATLTDAAGDPIPDIDLTLDPLDADASTTTRFGRIRTPLGLTTDDNGEVLFDYISGTTSRDVNVVIRGTAFITASRSTQRDYRLAVLAPPQPGALPSLNLLAPGGATTIAVPAAETTTGFIATVLDEDGAPVPSLTLTLIPTTASGESAGLILTSSGGSPGRTSFVTDSNGEVRFAYQAPRATSDTPVTLTGSFRIGSETQTDTLAVTVRRLAAATLSVEGPNREPTGAIEVESGQSLSGFSATLIDGRGAPVFNKALTLTPSLGTVRTVNGLATDAGGRVEFDYRAPEVTSRTLVTVVASASDVDGRTVSSSYQLAVLPPGLPPAPQVSLFGPDQASPNQTTATPYELRFVRIGGEPVQGARFTLSTTNGTISVIENGVVRPGLTSGVTDATGSFRFSHTPGAIGSQSETARITASFDSASGVNGSEVASQCRSDAEAICSAQLNVTVRADTFRFASPAYGEAATTGRDNATELTFDWIDADNQRISGCLNLATRFTGSANAVFGLVVGNDPTVRTQINRALLAESGAFANPVRVFSNRSGFLEIIAVENRDCMDGASGELTTTTALQFEDVIPEREFNVTLTGTSDAMTIGEDTELPLTVTVLNDASEPLDNIDVTFGFCRSATNPKANNEEISPGGGTTTANGVATTTYFLPSTFDPPITSTTQVTVTACITEQGFSACADEGSNVCDSFDIFVSPPAP
ncbi:MAG TPA: hypothetical protein VFV27_12850 [Nevskiaceae bacterium]|nr:hypothetical protein [Nevskiaceae bacterium]